MTEKKIRALDKENARRLRNECVITGGHGSLSFFPARCSLSVNILGQYFPICVAESTQMCVFSARGDFETARIAETRVHTCLLE